MANFMVACLDETGSMRGEEDRVVSSMNEYVEKLPDDVNITVFKFDTNRWTTFYAGDKSDWVDMTMDDYSPGAGTPLYDAIARSIEHAESISSAGDKVMIMIDTDGANNASRTHTKESIKSLVDQKKEMDWEFMFMASGIDQMRADSVASVGHFIGMSVSSAPYTERSHTYLRAVAATTSYFSGGSASAVLNDAASGVITKDEAVDKLSDKLSKKFKPTQGTSTSFF